MPPSIRRQEIKYWEQRRIVFNALVVGAAWFGWGISNDFNVGIDEIPGALITDPGVLWYFLKVFTAYNLAYSIGYGAELLFATNKLGKLWPTVLRPLFLVFVCLICMQDISSRSGKVAKETAYTKAGVFGFGVDKPVEDKTQPPIVRDGSDYSHAIVISAGSHDDGMAWAKQWLDNHIPVYQLCDGSLKNPASGEESVCRTNALMVQNDKIYSIVCVRPLDRSHRAVYFEVTSFFGKR